MKPNMDTRIIEALRSRGYKVTPQRLAICRLALADRDHPSVGTIHEEVRRIHPTVSLATVYKTIHVLRDIGLVQELCSINVEGRMDTKMEPHINLICQVCGSIYDLRDDPFQKEASELAKGTGILDSVQRVDVLGLCPGCTRSQRS
jgi:Fur family peroxide stress response transcriptional regulator